MQTSTMDSTDDGEASLIDYIRVIRRSAWLIVAGAVAGGVIAAIISALTPPTFESTAILRVDPVGTGAGLDPVRAYHYYFENQAVLRELVQEFALDKPPHQMTADTFAANNLTVEDVRNTLLLQVTVRFRDSALATRLLNRLIEKAKDLNNQLNQEDYVATQDYLKGQQDAAFQRLQEAELRLRGFKNAAQIDLLRKDMDALLEQRSRLLNVEIGIQVEKARLAKAEQELAGQQRILSVARSADTTSALLDLAKEGVPGLNLRNEVLNPVHEVLEFQVATSRTNLSALEEQRREVAGKFKDTQGGNLSQLYGKELDLATRQGEYDLARRVYSDVTARYEQERLRVGARKVEMHVLDAPSQATLPTSPHPLRNTALGVTVGLFLSVLLALAVSGFRSANRSS